MDDAARRRIASVLTRIAAVGASETLVPLLRHGSAHRRDAARAEAERIAVEAGRSTLVEEARGSVRDVLDARHGRFHPRVVYGWASDITTAADRVELSLALQDVVLAIAVEDLLPAATFDALAGDGAILIDDVRDAGQLATEDLEDGGPVDPDATPRRAIERLALVGVAIAAGLGGLVAWSENGPLAAIVAVGLAVSILFTVATMPGRRG